MAPEDSSGRFVAVERGAVTFTARPTVYRGVHMRSRLEAKCAAGLDRVGIPWVYEPCCFASADGQYLPDFRLTADPPWWYAEVKPVLPDPGSVQRRMEIIWASEPEASLFILAAGEVWRGQRGEWERIWWPLDVEP
jgi:hypothetical protein